jgi:single-stranded DNA-binding protein
MNNVSLVGRLTRAPTVRFEGDSQLTTTFILAVQEPSRAGKAYVLYVPCTSWGKSAEVASLLSGEDLVAVVGKLTWRKQQAKCGEVHSQLVVQVKDVAVLDATQAADDAASFGKFGIWPSDIDTPRSK